MALRIDTLLMPSAVAPSVETPFQALTSPEIRLRQTIQSVKRWLKLAKRYDFRIVVADNSGFADRLAKEFPRRIHDDKITFLDVPSPTRQSIQRGKGAGESESILFALRALQLHREAVIAKVNARYFTTNGMFLIDQIEDEFDFAAWPRPRLDTVDTTFFIAKAGFLETCIQRVSEEVDDLAGVFVEHLYADNSIRNPLCKFVRLNYAPANICQSGTTGTVASPWNEVRVVSFVVRLRALLRKRLKFLKPRYQRTALKKNGGH